MSIIYNDYDFDDKYEVFEHILGDSLNVPFLCYNSKVTEEIFGVLELIATNDFISNSDIAKKLHLKESHVELIQYLLCNNDHADYGTSPRGLWLTQKGKDLYKELLKWK